MSSDELPALVRRHFVREKQLTILAGSGERVLFRFPDGRVMSNWDLVRSPAYGAFKRGFKDAFKGRPSAAGDSDPQRRADYDAGFASGALERAKYGTE